MICPLFTHPELVRLYYYPNEFDNTPCNGQLSINHVTRAVASTGVLPANHRPSCMPNMTTGTFDGNINAKQKWRLSFHWIA